MSAGDAELMPMPIPGDALGGPLAGVVVVSVIVDEDAPSWTVLLLNGQPPYYTVATIRAGGVGYAVESDSSHPNIVPAVARYEQDGGDY